MGNTDKMRKYNTFQFQQQKIAYAYNIHHIKDKSSVLNFKTHTHSNKHLFDASMFGSRDIRPDSVMPMGRNEQSKERTNERTNGKMTEKSKMCMRVELVKWMVREGGVLSAKTMVRGNMAQKCYRAVNVVYV